MRKFKIDLVAPGMPTISVEVMAETSASALLWALHSNPTYMERCRAFVRPAR